MVERALNGLNLYKSDIDAISALENLQKGIRGANEIRPDLKRRVDKEIEARKPTRQKRLRLPRLFG